jgi:hypothetical protein
VCIDPASGLAQPDNRKCEVRMSHSNLSVVPAQFSRRLVSQCAIALCHRSVALALVLVLAWQSSLAQGLRGDWTNVRNLPTDSAISVKTRGGGKYHGDLVSVTADSLTLASDEPAFPGRTIRARDLKREEIQEVRLLEPAKSMFAGAAIGAGVGAGIGVALDSTAKSHEDRGVITVVLAFLGAGIGFAIARHHSFVKGKKVYEAS